jgi:uncharacterized protein (TIGR02246 family)
MTDMDTRTLWPVAVTLMLATGCAPASPSIEAEREQLELRQASFLTALAAKDAEATAAHFAEDAVVHVANMPPMRGRDAIRQFYGNVFRFLSASEPTPEVTRVSSGADMAYSVGRVVNAFEGEQGRVEYEGKFLLVWEKHDDRWLIAVYSISSNQAEGR